MFRQRADPDGCEKPHADCRPKYFYNKVYFRTDKKSISKDFSRFLLESCLWGQQCVELNKAKNFI